MTAALYLTIWLAVALFVAGEALASGAVFGRDPHRAAVRARAVHAAGLVLCVVHILISFDVVHGWSHAAAVAATAEQTRALFGLNWGGGVYANYFFVAVWALDTQWWRRSGGPGGPLSRGTSGGGSRAVTWALRAFYLIYLLNAAVVFAAGWRRALGLVLVVALAAVWGRRT